MPKIIPAILSDNIEDVEAKLIALPDSVDIVSIDIMDGTFVEQSTYFNAERINKIESEVLFELDLMVNDPLPIISAWAQFPRTSRAIVHVEIDQDIRELIGAIRELGLEAGIALLPNTQIADVEHLLNDVDMVLIRGNEPGRSGQELDPLVLGKIAELSQEYPELAIEVDIGVNKGTIPDLVRAGATHLAVNSAIFKAEDAMVAYDELQELAG